MFCFVSLITWIINHLFIYLFIYKYAELKIDVIDEQDGLEGKKVKTGSGIDEEYMRGIPMKKL